MLKGLDPDQDLDPIFLIFFQRLSADDKTLKAPITTAADDKFCKIFPNFQKK